MPFSSKKSRKARGSGGLDDCSGVESAIDAIEESPANFEKIGRGNATKSSGKTLEK